MVNKSHLSCERAVVLHAQGPAGGGAGHYRRAPQVPGGGGGHLVRSPLLPHVTGVSLRS